MPRVRVEVLKAEALSDKGDYFLVIKGNNSVKTTPHKGSSTIEPEWRETFHMVLKNENQQLKLDLQTKGFFGSKSVGSTFQRVNHLDQNVTTPVQAKFERGEIVHIKLTALDFGKSSGKPRSVAKKQKKGLFGRLFGKGPSKKDKAATQIQIWWLKMREANRLLAFAYLWRREVKAIKIQRWFRRMKIANSILPIAWWWRREVKAIKLQRWFRKMQRVKELMKIANWWRREVAAIKIQRFTRKIWFVRKLEAAAMVMREMRAVRRIQRRYRINKIRKCVRKIMEWSKHRNMIVKEITSTETSYVNGLGSLVQVFYHPLVKDADDKNWSASDIQKMFGNLLELHGTNSAFLAELQGRTSKWKALDGIGDLFLKWLPFFKAYPIYINQYDDAIRLVDQKIKDNRKFRKWIDNRKGATDMEKGYAWMSSLLITPIQRVPRYELLLRDLLKFSERLQHSDCPSLEQALVKVKEIAKYINEQKRKDEANKKLYELMQMSAMGTQLRFQQLGDDAKHEWTKGMNTNLNTCQACDKQIIGLGRVLWWCKVCMFTCHKDCRSGAPSKCLPPTKGIVKMNLLETHQERAIKKEQECMHTPIIVKELAAAHNPTATISPSALGNPKPCVAFLFTDALGIAYKTNDSKTPYKFVHMEPFISPDGLHVAEVQEAHVGVPKGRFGFSLHTTEKDVHVLSFDTPSEQAEWLKDCQETMDNWIGVTNKRRSSMYSSTGRSPLEDYPEYQAMKAAQATNGSPSASSSTSSSTASLSNNDSSGGFTKPPSSAQRSAKPRKVKKDKQERHSDLVKSAPPTTSGGAPQRGSVPPARPSGGAPARPSGGAPARPGSKAPSRPSGNEAGGRGGSSPSLSFSASSPTDYTSLPAAEDASFDELPPANLAAPTSLPTTNSWSAGGGMPAAYTSAPSNGYVQQQYNSNPQQHGTQQQHYGMNSQYTAAPAASSPVNGSTASPSSGMAASHQQQLYQQYQALIAEGKELANIKDPAEQQRQYLLLQQKYADLQRRQEAYFNVMQNSMGMANQ